jgi:glycosyltransferase involved in cell wall biosynthesis
LFLGYSFGLPVIATDVGSMKEDVIEGRTGFLCAKQDPANMAAVIESYFESELYRCLHDRRKGIMDYANERYSWETVSQMTRNVYVDLLVDRP